jgi:signal transduction histidine kinase
VLRIQDNGNGLPKNGPKNTGMGLRVIQHRARMIGGTASIRPRKGERGVVVTCMLRKNILMKRGVRKKGGHGNGEDAISLQRSGLQRKLGLSGIAA